MFRSATAFLPEGPTIQDSLVKKVKGKGKAKISKDDALGAESVLKCLSHWAKEKEGDGALIVAVVGVANVRLLAILFYSLFYISSGRQKFFDQLSGQTSSVTHLHPCLFIQRTIYY